jgi:drug/metabolite transporter (DMT)-like permease
MSNDKFLGLTLSLVASLIWGVSAPLIKYLLYYLTGFDIALLRALIVIIVLYPFIRFFSDNTPAIPKKHLSELFILSLFGASIMWLSINYSILYSTAIEATLLTSFTTPLTILIAYIYLGERLKWNELLSILIGVTGIILVITRGEPLSIHPKYFLGYTLALTSALSWSLYTISYRKFSLELSDKVILFNMFLFATPIFLVTDLYGSSRLHNIIHIDVIVILIFLGVISTVAGFWLFNISVKKIGASLASLPLMIVPFISTVVSWLWLYERVPMISLIGGGLLIASIGIAYIK